MKKVWYIVSAGLTRATATILVEKGRNHVTMMETNPAFLAPNPVPLPSLAAITAACATLDAANQAYAFNKGKVEKEARDVAFAALKVLVLELSQYVQRVSGGDKELILSAGFDVKKKPTSQGIPSVPQDVRAEATRRQRQILVRWGASRGHRLYKAYRTEGDPTLETGWELIAETGKNRLVDEVVERFKTYSYRIVAVGTVGNSVASDAASATAA